MIGFHSRPFRAAPLFLLPFFLAGAAPARSTVEYRLAPVSDGGALSEVAVDIRMRADADGETILELPNEYGGVKQHWRYLSPLVVTGATVSAPSPDKRLLRSAANVPLTIRYRVKTAYVADPEAADANPYNGAIIRPGWFASLGEFLFVTPQGRDAEPATFSWAGWPAQWTKALSADRHTLNVADLVESSFIAGPDVQLRTRRILGGNLRLASRGGFDWSMDGYADRVARVIDAQRRFWRDRNGDYTVTLFQLTPSVGSSSMGGTGRSHGFVQYASPDSPSDGLFRLIAHEHQHNWIPRQLGTPPAEAGSAFWFSEGFTDFYTARTLLRAGLWTPQQFADDLNRTLVGIAALPPGNYPNGRIVAQFWSDPSVGQLPYDRGHLFAHLLDWQLRRAGKAGLDAVMFAMHRRWKAAPANAKPKLTGNLLAVLDSQQFDARPLIAKHIEAGVPVQLPAELFGKCASVVQTSIPVFDVGFDREASAKAGAFAGVDPRGAAYAAGLRDGMKRVARLGGQEGDFRVPLRYRVSDGRSERVVSWLPEGKELLTLQEVRVLQASSRCRSQLSGGTQGSLRPPRHR